MYHIDSRGRIRVEPGNYEITRLPVSRYKFVANGKNTAYNNDTKPTLWEAYTDPDTHESSEKLILEAVAGKTVDVHYYDSVGYYDKFSQTDTVINRFYKLENGKNKTIKGIRIDDYHQNGTTDTNSGTMTVPVSKLTIYKIYSDGSEEEMNAAEKAAITDFNVTYIYDSASGDAESFGNAASPDNNDFSYNSSTKIIKVNNVSAYQNGVYTLNADYKGFKAAFDLVFLRP